LEILRLVTRFYLKFRKLALDENFVIKSKEVATIY